MMQGTHNVKFDNCIGCWDANPLCQHKTNLLFTKSSINRQGRRVYKSEEVPIIQCIQPKTPGKIVNLNCHVTNQTLHMSFVKDEIRRLALAYHKHFLRQGKDSIARPGSGMKT